MSSSFVAYIDESGDEGFVFLPDNSGSSRWLVLSAVVVRKENERFLIDTAKSARAMLGKPDKDPLHFCKMKNHEHRVAVCSLIGKARIRTISILAHKELIDIAIYRSRKNCLYHYLTRLLLERISWLCRDKYTKGVGDGTVELIFSNRGCMSYEELRNYITLLKTKTKNSNEDIRIDWSVINPDKVRSVQGDKMAGLQIADFVASGTKWAAEKNRFGNAEPAYFKKLKSRLYVRKNKALGYGLKFFPSLDKIKPANPHLEEFAGL